MIIDCINDHLLVAFMFVEAIVREAFPSSLNNQQIDKIR
jgi:hypothetical protein